MVKRENKQPKEVWRCKHPVVFRLLQPSCEPSGTRPGQLSLERCDIIMQERTKKHILRTA